MHWSIINSHTLNTHTEACSQWLSKTNVSLFLSKKYCLFDPPPRIFFDKFNKYSASGGKCPIACIMVMPVSILKPPQDESVNFLTCSCIWTMMTNNLVVVQEMYGKTKLYVNVYLIYKATKLFSYFKCHKKQQQNICVTVFIGK